MYLQLKRFPLLLTLAFLVPALLFGQADARIWGTVTDVTGAMVPGADVAIVHEGTNNVRRTQTNAAGQFAAAQLEPGRYRVEVQAAGFKKTTQSGLELRVGDSVEIRVPLQLGQLTETVEVTDTTPLLQSTSSAVGEVIENRMITDLPLNNRQPLQLALMVPGVNPGRQMTSSSQPFNRSNNFSVGGGRGNVNEIMLDGTSNTMPEGNPAFSAVTVFPSVDSIQEFRVQTNAYSVEYGNSGGGLVNIVSKSGTNSLQARRSSSSATAGWTRTTSSTTAEASRWRVSSATSSAARPAGRYSSRASTTGATAPSSSPPGNRPSNATE